MTPQEWLEANPNNSMNDYYEWQRQQVNQPPQKDSHEHIAPVAKSSTFISTIIKAVIFAAVFFGGLTIYNNYQKQEYTTGYDYSSSISVPEISRQKTAPEVRRDLKNIEIENPFNYVSSSADYRIALLKNKIVLSGNISNSATLATYKDFKYRIEFYSKTGTMIGTNEHRVYEEVAPGKSQTFFNERVNIPSGFQRTKIGSVNINLIGATGY